MSFLKIWDRIKAETDLVKLSQLADFIGVSQQYVSKKKKEDNFPVEWGYKIAIHYRLTTEWVLTGEGPKKFGKDQTYNFSILKELDEWLSEVVVKNPDRRQWFSVIICDTFPMFKEWLQRREERESKNSESADKKIA